MKFAENNGVHECNQIKLHFGGGGFGVCPLLKRPAGKSIHCREGKLWTETQILFVQSFQVSPASDSSDRATKAPAPKPQIFYPRVRREIISSSSLSSSLTEGWLQIQLMRGNYAMSIAPSSSGFVCSNLC